MIVVEPFSGKSVADHRVEIVERKGTGHPDYICDSVMEAVSVALCKEYKKEFGAVLHHNIDKGLLAAGRTVMKFGGGRVLRPMELVIGDRATFAAGGKKIPVKEIAISAARCWIKDNLRFVDAEKHLKCRPVLSPGSEELTDIFQRQSRVLAANDTSAAVGYYPLSPTESAVLALERHLNSRKFKSRFPETGEDVKVMGLRTGRRLDFTVAMPLMAAFIDSEREYFNVKEKIRAEMAKFLNRNCDGFDSVEVNFNTLDVRGRGLGGVYLSLLGTSAEDADSGQVGRGNRVNGLISLNRPMGTEAAAGKNPVSHVGKIYNILAHKAAESIYKKVEGIKEVYVLLLSRIGTPIDRPQTASVQVVMEKGANLRNISGDIKDVIVGELKRIPKLCEGLSDGRYRVC